MKTTKIINSVNCAINKAGFKFKKHSPEILIVTGIIGTVTSAVMACKATTKVSYILEETKETVNKIHEVSDNKDLVEKHEYSENDKKKDLVITYTQTGIKFVKLYAPSIILGTLSIVSILASNNILRKRNVALAAAYATMDKGFKEYRQRVIERFGKQLDKELRYNIKAKEIEEIVIGEDGKETAVKKTVEVVDPNVHSDYARFFDEASRNWEKDAEHNLYFLRCAQNHANDKLRADGFLFLNWVYDYLDIPKTKAGQVVGWVYDPDNPKYHNYIDFGMYDLYREKSRDFVNGYERSILLDFNVDGNILDLM